MPIWLDEQSLVVTSDMTIHYRAVVVRVEVYDERNGPLAAACQLAFTVIRPQA